MIKTLIQNTKAVALLARNGDRVSLRFTELDGRIYIIMADLWPYLDARGQDMIDCIDDLSRAESAFAGDESGHVITDGTWCCAVEETEGAYLSREAAALLALTVYPRSGSPLASIFHQEGLKRAFAQVAELYA